MGDALDGGGDTFEECLSGVIGLIVFLGSTAVEPGQWSGQEAWERLSEFLAQHLLLSYLIGDSNYDY